MLERRIDRPGGESPSFQRVRELSGGAGVQLAVMRMTRPSAHAIAALLASCFGACTTTITNAPASMSFFITSVGAGDGANLGGLEGADAHCQKLAAAVGAGNRSWRAYLSAPATGAHPSVNARDRIGKGPWLNVHG